MEESNNIELKEKILGYLQLPNKIEYWQLEKQLFSRIFYAKHSMTGSMPIGDPTDEAGTRPVSPEYGAIVIADSEAIIQRKIDRASRKMALFNDLMPFLDAERLIADQQLYYVTELEYQALEAINEVEYYLTEHQKTKERLKGYGLNEEQQAQMADVGNKLLNRIKELAL